MTIFKDRLAATIRIKKRFAPSAERIRISRSWAVVAFYTILAVILAAIILRWLEL